MPESPDNLRWSLSLRLAPDAGQRPCQITRDVLRSLRLPFGSVTQRRAALCLDHILSLYSPVAVTRKNISFLALQTMADEEFPHGRRYYTKSGYCKALDDNTIDLMAQSLAICSVLP